MEKLIVCVFVCFLFVGCFKDTCPNSLDSGMMSDASIAIDGGPHECRILCEDLAMNEDCSDSFDLPLCYQNCLTYGNETGSERACILCDPYVSHDIRCSNEFP